MEQKRCLQVAVAGVLLAMAGCSADDPVHNHAPLVRNVDDQPTITFPGHPMKSLIESADSEGGISLFEVTVPPKTSGPPPHIHQHEDEYFIILEGELRVLNGDDIITARPGMVATLTRGHQHTFWNNTDKDVRYLLGIAPGHFGGFFDQVVMDIQARGAVAPQEIIAIVGERAAQRGVELFPNNIPPEQGALLGPPPAQ